MSMLPALSDLVAQSGTSAPSFFNKNSKVGDEVTGQVLDVQVRQAIDPQTNKRRVWENGDPTLQVYIEIQTEGLDPVDDNDDGTRGLFIKWWGVQRKQFLAALTAAKQEDLTIGQTITAKFTGIEKATNKAMSDTKLYEYTIS